MSVSVLFPTSPVQPRVIVQCMGTDMKTCTTIESQSLLPAESLAITASMGALLSIIGSLLMEHPELSAELSPETGLFLLTIGGKLNRCSLPVE
jgi:hypothetical protein